MSRNSVQKLFFFVASLLLIFYAICMDVIEIPSQGNQKHIIIPFSDDVFVLDKWKIFESRALHRHYLNHQELCDVYGILPLFSGVTTKEMQLCSDALDCDSVQELAIYVMGLLPDERSKLITAAGKYDEHKKKNKLNIPGLTAQLLDACIPSDICKHINGHLQKDAIVEYIIAKKIATDAHDTELTYKSRLLVYFWAEKVPIKWDACVCYSISCPNGKEQAFFADRLYELYQQDVRFEWLAHSNVLFCTYVLHRLRKADKNNDQVNLHAQESTYKLLQSLPSEKECDVLGMLHQCLPGINIVNKDRLGAGWCIIN